MRANPSEVDLMEIRQTITLAQTKFLYRLKYHTGPIEYLICTKIFHLRFYLYIKNFI